MMVIAASTDYFYIVFPWPINYVKEHRLHYIFKTKTNVMSTKENRTKMKISAKRLKYKRRNPLDLFSSLLTADLNITYLFKYTLLALRGKFVKKKKLMLKNIVLKSHITYGYELLNKYDDSFLSNNIK